jgi:hypothetical protein
MLGAASLVLPFAASTAEADADAVAEERPSRPGGATEVPPQVPTELTTTSTGQEDPGLLFLSPGTDGNDMSAAMYDNSGELVWWGQGRNLAELTYQGEPVLCLYRDDGQGGYEYVLLDSSYTEIAAFSMAGYATDAHDVAFSPDGSRVLMLSYNPVAYDLSEYGGPAEALVLDLVVQEQDVATGEVTFEWSALDHVPLEESHWPLTWGLVDYMHGNSLEYDTDGDLLLSARNTSAVYKIDLDSGDIVWRFGGENSDFTFADPADMPDNQHDARRLADGSLSVFDNGTFTRGSSRGAVYDLDEEAMTAELVADLRPEEDVFALAMGSNRRVAGGNQLVSYGNTREIVEFSGTEPVFTASLPEGIFTYRAERSLDWQGTPAAPPDVTWSEPAADGGGGDGGGNLELRVSWNGATGVESWRVEVGGEVVQTVPKTGFETAVEVTLSEGASAEDAVRVSALDNAGDVLGSRTLTEPAPALAKGEEESPGPGRWSPYGDHRPGLRYARSCGVRTRRAPGPAVRSRCRRS